MSKIFYFSSFLPEDLNVRKDLQTSRHPEESIRHSRMTLFRVLDVLCYVYI